MLEQEEAFYEAHQAEFREKYLNKWLVIVGDTLVGDFDTTGAAIAAAHNSFGDRDFMLRRPVDDGAVLEVGPMGIVKVHRPYAAKKPQVNPVITTSGNGKVVIPYAW